MVPCHWTEFHRHRENGIIRADSNDGVPVYLTELDGETVAATETMEETETLREIGTEEAVLVDLFRGCNVEPAEDRRTSFENFLREKITFVV